MKDDDRRKILDTEQEAEVAEGAIVDGDEALAYAAGIIDHDIDVQQDKKLLRKIDLYICLMMCFVYAVQYMDKQTNSYASIMGLRTDLDMYGDRYSWVGSSFYLGYMVSEIPSSIALQKLPMAKVSSIFIVCWGLTLSLTSLSKSYAGFIVARVVLGILEACVTPAFVLLTSQWYKREEQFLRISIWSASNGMGTIVGALTAHGLAQRDPDSLPMTAWRLLYVILGVITIALGIIFFIHVPDLPTKAWFLDEKEKQLVVERIRSNNQGFGNRHIKFYQIKETFVDVRTYIYFFVAVAAEIPNGGLGNFGSIVLTNMGYKSSMALLMGTPQGAVEFVGIIAIAYVAHLYNQRLIVAILSFALNIISGCLLAFPESIGAQLTGYYLQGLATIGWICFLSCVASNSAGHTKKVLTAAIVMIGYCVGNLIGPQTFISKEAPGYHSAKIVIVVMYAFCLVLSIALYVINVRANKLRDEQNLHATVDNAEFADLTDFENPEFRYAI